MRAAAGHASGSSSSVHLGLVFPGCDGDGDGDFVARGRGFERRQAVLLTETHSVSSGFLVGTGELPSGRLTGDSNRLSGAGVRGVDALSGCCAWCLAAPRVYAAAEEHQGALRPEEARMESEITRLLVYSTIWLAFYCLPSLF